MSPEKFNDGLISFLQSSPTPFHAARSLGERLEYAGFERLREAESWRLAPGKSYYLTRNESSLIAFRTGSGELAGSGVRMAGAHTDSPCLRVKPQPEILRQGYLQLGVEIYGGALLNPWFDRDLSIAGRVNYLDGQGRPQSALVDFNRPVAVIPSLAIHLDRDVNQNRSINAQNHLPPLLLQPGDSEKPDFREILKAELTASDGVGDVGKILDYELCLYDVQAPALVGLSREFLAGARLDNLLSCYVGLEALLSASGDMPALLVCSDHEEVGSVSTSGAAGTFLEAVLERLGEQLGGGGRENYRRMLENSFMVSLDNAHGIHPNYADRHDQQHGPLLNRGPVIKMNANQRYATNSETSAMFRRLCAEEEVPLQSFVVRSDMGCGSTIGPITAGRLGVRTLDVGVPTFAMHSIRELAGTRDAGWLMKAVTRYFQQP